MGQCGDNYTKLIPRTWITNRIAFKLLKRSLCLEQCANIILGEGDKA